MEQEQKKYMAEPCDASHKLWEIRRKLELNINSCENKTFLRNILAFFQEPRQEQLLVEAIREQTISFERLKEHVLNLQKNQQETEDASSTAAAKISAQQKSAAEPYTADTLQRVLEKMRSPVYDVPFEETN
jgi:hypothetical protein